MTRDWNDAHRAEGLPGHPADLAEDMPPPEDGAPAELEPAPAVDLVRWHVRAAVAELISRVYPEGGRAPVTFPWPGCEPGWPDAPEEGRVCYTEGEPLPGGQRADWRPLWRLVGPLSPDRLVVVVGPTGRGKTALAVQASEAAAAAGCPVIYMSVELGAAELAARHLAVRARGAVPWSAYLRGRVSKPDLETAGEDLVRDCPALYLWAPPAGGRSCAELALLTRAVSRAHADAPVLVVVDYLQRMDPDNPARRGDLRQQIADISGALRALSRPDGAWPGAGVLALSTTARSNYGKISNPESLGTMFWSDPDGLIGLGKETGEIEADAPVLVVLTCAALAEAGGMRAGFLAAPKVRDGSPGALSLRFDGARGQWDGMVVSRRPLPKSEKGRSGADRAANDEPEAAWPKDG